ncbi:VQ motif-containing protein 4 [Silene latifolia]|uniref:VQ motif-containing protein 4 n=1 Tax=Silene latifolia TaxID=37657 RepID=UPI003D78259C
MDPLPSPTTSNGPTQNPTLTRSDPSNPYPTTFVQADTSSFKQVVQLLTGSSEPKHKPNSNPHLKPNPKSRPSTKLYERRNNSFKHSLVLPTPAGHHPGHSGHSTPYPLSPSILDFPSLMLSPVTPLLYDPFSRSSPSCSPNTIDKIAEDKAIAEKTFFLHPVSPVSVSEQPRLLPLFPVTSPTKVSSSMN